MPRLGLLIVCIVVVTSCGGKAVAPDPVKLRRGNLVVVETHVPREITFAQFARNEPEMLRRATKASRIRASFTTYNGRRALRVSYRLGRKRIVRYFVRRGALMYVSTYTWR